MALSSARDTRVATTRWFIMRLSVFGRMRLAAHLRGDVRMRGAVARYAFAVVAVAAAFALRMALAPMTGRGVPYILLFPALLATSFYAGVGPAMLAFALSLLLAAATFVVRPGHMAQAAFQTLLYAANGMLLVYLAALIDQRRRRVQETVDLSPDAYFLAGLDARIAEVNHAACRLLGYEREELVGKSGFDLVPAEELTRLRAMRAGLMARSGTHTAEWTLRRKDGSMLPVEVSSNILPDGRWQAFVRDITARRRIAAERDEHLMRETIARRRLEATNEQLRESEERFRLTIDDAPIGMALIALDGRYVRVNQALCEITGFSAAELLTLNARFMTHPDDRAEDAELGRKLMLGEIPRYHREKRYVRKDQTVIDVSVSGSALRGPDGKPRYFITQVENITRRKRAVEALRLSEAKFAGIVSIAADAIISVDETQRIVLFNDGAQRMFGYTQHDAIGMPLERLIPERFRAVHGEHFAHFVAGRDTARTMAARQEIFGLRRNGEEFPAEASISKVAVGGTMLFSVVMQDISYRKSVEAALRRAVAARDDVLGIVAHDLRNPLSTIIAQASMMQRPEPDAERRDETGRLVIMRSAQRMNALIQDLLDVAVVEAGQMKVERARIPVTELTRDVVEAGRVLASSAKCELRLEASEDVPAVWGDRNRLLRVFDNLISNALKFTKEGGHVTIGVSVKNDAVVFSVADTGPGIPPEHVSHIFDRFWQAAGRASRLGAGLGLPISRGIVEAHGGHIWVESTLGRGSTFFFTIPIAPAELGASPVGPEREADRPAHVA